ncbi:glycosyl transferases group 1 family protein, partial [Chlamydia psittaci 84-8471/1]
ATHYLEVYNSLF